ncbi:MAG: thioredoxin-dependent thiol peroxidase [Bacteroidales bacterium]|nr:thioredoxin-dependent thiol peroxidase [Bacteroidales bacterium]
MTHLKEGDIIPDFEKFIEKKNIKGKKVILYFYPKDNTPGCTNEAINLRDNYDTLKNNNFEVIGISPDSEQSHEKFSNKLKLPFKLIADTEKIIMTNCGVWGEKKMYGRTFDGVFRTTFVTDDKGIILKIFKKVKTKEHFEQIMKAFNE